jgi:NADH:ubiquinone oxidoreductase subunit E
MSVTTDDKMNILEEYMQEMKKQPYAESHLIGILHKAQELYGYLKQEVMEKIAYTMNIPAAKIWGVASFYHYFNLEPVGKYILSLCLGTACYVKGAGKILDKMREHLNIDVGQTTEDGLFTLQEARCLGACGLAPVLMVNDRIYGKLTVDSIVELLDTLKKEGSEGL